MKLAPFLAVRRARFNHAAAFYGDDAMAPFMREHTAALCGLPPCRSNVDALAIVEELRREDTAQDMGTDRAALLNRLAAYLSVR